MIQRYCLLPLGFSVFLVVNCCFASLLFQDLIILYAVRGEKELLLERRFQKWLWILYKCFRIPGDSSSNPGVSFCLWPAWIIFSACGISRHLPAVWDTWFGCRVRRWKNELYLVKLLKSFLSRIYKSIIEFVPPPWIPVGPTAQQVCRFLLKFFFSSLCLSKRICITGSYSIAWLFSTYSEDFIRF